MKRPVAVGTITLILLALAASVVSCREEASPHSGLAKVVRRAVHPLRLDGTAVKVDPSVAPLTVLHFWATWCPPCVEELPAYARFVARKQPPGVRTFAIAVEPDAPAVASYLSTNKIHIVSLFDPKGEYAAQFGFDVLPATVLLDRTGKVITTVQGPTDWDNEAVQKTLAELAAK